MSDLKPYVDHEHKRIVMLTEDEAAESGLEELPTSTRSKKSEEPKPED